MKKTYKVLALVGDCESFCEILEDEEIRKQVYYNECPNLQVLEIDREDWKDCIKIVRIHFTIAGSVQWHDDYSLLRTSDGKLYLCDEIWSKLDIINKFE